MPKSDLPPVPMFRFEVYPGRDNWMAPDNCDRYFTICIYADLGWMRRAYRMMSPHTPEERIANCAAAVIPMRRIWVQRNKRDKISPNIGFVLFARRYAGMEVITHESVHMATTYVRAIRRSLNLGPDIEEREERLAYAVGNIARQIASKCHELKVYE